MDRQKVVAEILGDLETLRDFYSEIKINESQRPILFEGWVYAVSDLQLNVVNAWLIAVVASINKFIQYITKHINNAHKTLLVRR